MTVRPVPSLQVFSFPREVKRRREHNERETLSPLLLVAQTYGSRVQGWRDSRSARGIRNDRHLERLHAGGERVRADPAHGGKVSGLLRRDGPV